MEKIVETYKIENAIFELIEKSEVIYAGKFFYVKNYAGKQAWNAELEKLDNDWEMLNPYKNVIEPILPIIDIGISINYSLGDETKHGYGYGRETTTENQPEGVDVFKMPASLYVKAHINENMAMLLSKQKDIQAFDIVAEVFPYIWDNVMPAHGLKIAENGAQDLEIYNPIKERKPIYLYAAAMRR
jgi:predicted transcriptional regulator YdeE